LAVVNSLNKVDVIFDPYKEYFGLFNGLGVMPEVFKITMKDNVKSYRLCAPRTIAAGLKDKAKLELDKMLKLDVIEPVEEPTEWCSGLTIAPKSNGKIRMCVDLTMLNKGVQRELYPLPRVSDMLSQLSRGKVFSKLDANSGFWQVMLEPKSKLLTTFITPWGRFCFKRMPFGISSAPEFFQRCMTKILHGLDGVVCMMDDVLVYGENDLEHWSRLRKVLDKIRESGMTLQKDKCEFGLTSVKFLGHIVSQEGIRLDPDKVKAIHELSPPTNKKEGRRLMGMVNYLNKFSKCLAEYSIPIYGVIGSKSEWHWGLDQIEAFEKIKKVLSETPVLCAFDINRLHRVSADASRNAIGAVLLQYNEKGQWQPVEYASRKLTDAECRYAMIEKESLAITWACDKFDFYLVGRQFEIETDHKPLVNLLGEKDLSQLPLRVQRFKMRMMRYDFTIFHTAGNKMYVADFLSRPNNDSTSDKTINECNEIERYVANIIEESLLNSYQERELIRAFSNDKDSKLLYEYLEEGWPSDIDELSDELKKLYCARDNLTQYGELILFGSRLYIPKGLRIEYLKRCHEGHQGIVKCRRRAQELFWWPGSSADISNYINNCEVCIKASRVKHQPADESPLPEGSWVEVGTDVFEMNSKLYLLLVDYYSKWIEVRELDSQTTANVIKEFKSVFSCLGVPKILRSDNGPCYRSVEFSAFAEKWCFIHKTSSPRYPQSNGLAERSVGTIKSLWYKSKNKDEALLTYRTTPLRSGYSPGELMFGRPLRSTLGKPLNDDVDFNNYEEVEENLKSVSREKWNNKYRAKVLPELKVGTKVWIKSPSDIGSEGIVERKTEYAQSLV